MFRREMTRMLLTVLIISLYASRANLITQNRELFESRDQSSIDEAINILEDLDPDELNSDGIAIEEIMNNEGAVVIEDTDFLIDNPGNDNTWTVDPNADSGTKPTGGSFNVPNLNTEGRNSFRCVAA